MPVGSAWRRANALIGPERPKSAVAKRISQGTSHSKTGAGVCSSSMAPRIPPARDGNVPAVIQRPSPRSSRRKPCRAATAPGTSETVFVALAMIGSRPSHTSTGKVMSEPPPATEFTAPAAAAAANRTGASATAFKALSRDGPEGRSIGRAARGRRPSARAASCRRDTGTLVIASTGRRTGSA